MGFAEKIIQVDFKKGKIKAKPRKTGEGLVRSPKLSDVDALRKSMNTAKTEDELRSFVVLEFLCRFGMRASELCLLKKSDFQNIQGVDVLRYYRPKRNDFHTVKISQDAKNFLLGLIADYHKEASVGSDHILWSLPNHITGKRTELTTRSLQRIVSGFGILDGRGKPISPHSLRHYVGVRSSKEKDHAIGSKILGNSIKVFSEYYSDPWEEALE